MNTRWLYKVVVVKPQFLGPKPEIVESTLASLGLQGWELVSVVQLGMNVNLYLKKEA
ncbi:hypothetical protein [Thermomonas paludicola]|uniref:hypothetical protein n=1 Tax=Thermomonas paludicola TaxID=2884874 RepID=UPI0021144A9D|nr:hypothetical protein [Thermomonas paludicola]